jgi:hypothetical protein
MSICRAHVKARSLHNLLSKYFILKLSLDVRPVRLDVGDPAMQQE